MKLSTMETWDIITCQEKRGEPVNSRDDLIIGRLMVDMDQLGFGPKDGYDTEELKRIADFIRHFVRSAHREYYQRNLERLSSAEMDATGIGMEVVESAPGMGRVRVRFNKGLINSNGVVHGGVVSSAADAATAVALLSLMEAGERMATTEMKINFIKPVQACDVIAEAHILHRGGHTAVGEVTVRDGAGNLVAKALATYSITKLHAPAVKRKRVQKKMAPTLKKTG